MAERRTILLCRECRAWHAEQRPTIPLCTCSVIDARQSECACDATVIRAAAGIAGWGVIPVPADAIRELSHEPCATCQRPLPFGGRWRATAYNLKPAAEVVVPDEAWLRAASPGSRAAAVMPVADD